MNQTTPAATQSDFLSDLARQLRDDGTAFDPRDLAVWLASCWRIAAEDPAPERWAQEFRQARDGVDVFCP